MPAALALTLLPTSSICAQDATGVPSAMVQSEDAGAVQFSFAGASWREVIQWLADEANLALHVGELPTGSFTYSDPSSFTYAEAIDRVNLFLLPQGYALVRSGQLLSVINLGDPRSVQQLDAIADLVTVDDLSKRPTHDVVKCIFPLGDIDHDEAVQELNVLKLMTTPSVLSKTNQLMITDTVSKLRNVKAILDAFATDGLDNGTVVKSFALKYVDAEDVLLVARPHLGLATGEMIGIDVSLSADIQGKNIFVTGVEDKVKLLEGLVEAIDQPEQSQSAGSGEAILKSHLVEGGNVETVYNVLQTLLAGKSVRLSMDETSSSVVALATPEIQKEIADTVEQLQASAPDFAVIQLKTIDPYLAVSLLEEMLDLAEARRRASAGMEAFTRHGNSRGLDVINSSMEDDVPRIDADPVNRRLFVRAKQPQLDQIKEMVAELDQIGGSAGNSEDVRLFPLSGTQARRVLNTAAKFWRWPNPIVLLESDEDPDLEITERLAGDDAEEQSVGNPEPTIYSSSDLSNQRWLTSKSKGAPEIRCQLTQRGVLIQSDDLTALDRFEEHLRTIAGPVDTVPSPPIVFYLKYTKAEDALRMLAELLDGGELASEGESGSLVNGYVSSSFADSFLGSFVTSRDGTVTMEAGSITVVADSRLNRLIAQGTALDIERIESYLKIIDKDDSITSIETYGTSRVIELVNTKASEVAAVIRDAYSGRIAGSPTGGQPGQVGGGSPDQRREEQSKEKEDESRQPAKKNGKAAPATPPKSLEPKMTIAVHEPSNSLVVTAPEQLFEEVEKLARTIDRRGEQTIEVVTPVSALVLESVLQRVLLGQEPTSRPTTRPTSSTPSRPQFFPQPRPKTDR